MAIVIRKISIAEIEAAPNFQALVDEYAAEGALEGLPTPATKLAIYKDIEAACIFHTFGAYFDDLLVGFLAVLTSVSPHYGAPVSTSESFFVSKEHRKTGAGLKLLHEAERYGKESGSSGILVCSPSGSPLSKILECVGYRETHSVFFRSYA
jgi:GNAT superfamily N-acetyltransferase